MKGRHNFVLIVRDLQGTDGSAVRRKAITDYNLEGDGHISNPNGTGVSGLTDDRVKASSNQTKDLSDDRPLLTTEVAFSFPFWF